MLVKRILEELDAELEQLQSVRNTIAALIVPSAKKIKRVARHVPDVAFTAPATALPAGEAAQEPEMAVEPAPEPALTSTLVPARRRGRPKGSVNRTRIPVREPRARTPREREATALNRAVATGPVFVSAAELERRRKQPAVMPASGEHKPFEGTLDSLIREVADRRTAA